MIDTFLLHKIAYPGKMTDAKRIANIAKLTMVLESARVKTLPPVKTVVAQPTIDDLSLTTGWLKKMSKLDNGEFKRIRCLPLSAQIAEAKKNIA